MIRKICPVCDQVMKMPHYCRNCHSWVKEPYVRDVNYYLNERHSGSETDYSYHSVKTAPAGAMGTASRGMTSTGTAPGGTASYNTASGWHPKKQESLPQRRPQDNRFPPPYGRTEKPKKRKNPAIIVVVCVIVIIFIVQLLFTVVNMTSRMNDVYDSLFGDSGYDMDLGDYSGEDWEFNYRIVIGADSASEEVSTEEQDLSRGEQHL